MMESLLQKIISNESNLPVLKFMGYLNLDKLSLIPFSEVTYYTHEGLEDFRNLGLPSETKYLLNNHGIFVHPKSGEIFAFQFGRSEIALKNKQTNSEKFMSRFFWRRRRPQNYFSNEAGDDVIDLTELGLDWALSINYVDSYEDRMINYYNSIC